MRCFNYIFRKPNNPESEQPYIKALSILGNTLTLTTNLPPEEMTFQIFFDYKLQPTYKHVFNDTLTFFQPVKTSLGLLPHDLLHQMCGMSDSYHYHMINSNDEKLPTPVQFQRLLVELHVFKDSFSLYKLDCADLTEAGEYCNLNQVMLTDNIEVIDDAVARYSTFYQKNAIRTLATDKHSLLNWISAHKTTCGVMLAIALVILTAHILTQKEDPENGPRGPRP
jgi:hypothetical protein